jgi:hypothetical protein
MDNRISGLPHPERPQLASRGAEKRQQFCRSRANILVILAVGLVVRLPRRTRLGDRFDRVQPHLDTRLGPLSVLHAGTPTRSTFFFLSLGIGHGCHPTGTDTSGGPGRTPCACPLIGCPAVLEDAANGTPPDPLEHRLPTGSPLQEGQRPCGGLMVVRSGVLATSVVTAARVARS